jgi:hypothetical protein
MGIRQPPHPSHVRTVRVVRNQPKRVDVTDPDIRDRYLRFQAHAQAFVAALRTGNVGEMLVTARKIERSLRTLDRAINKMKRKSSGS